MTSRGLAGALPFLLSLQWAVAASAQPVTFARTDYPSDAGTRGIASADFNGDHRPDIATANTGVNNVTILLNKGNGQFEDSGLTIPLISTWPKFYLAKTVQPLIGFI